MASITHAYPETLSTAQLVSELVARLVNGEDKDTALNAVAVRYGQDFDTAMSTIVRSEGYTGGCYTTAGIALASFMRASSAKEAILCAVNATVEFQPWANDVDTYAAVTGALAGAYWGVNAIPEEWMYPTNPREKGRQYNLRPHSINELSELAGKLLLGAS
jgi:ADP-ribosyl-[dinitrogen reductase] hydrolase